MKFKVQYIVIAACLLLIMYLSIFSKPNINFSTEINNISKKDYQIITDNNQIVIDRDEGIDNFKKVSINIKIKSPHIFVKDVKINTPILSRYLEDNNIIILSDGGLDAYMEKTEYALVYLNNGNKKILNDILKDFKYVVTWSNMWSKTGKEIFCFNDYLK